MRGQLEVTISGLPHLDTKRMVSAFGEWLVLRGGTHILRDRFQSVDASTGRRLQTFVAMPYQRFNMFLDWPLAGGGVVTNLQC